MCSLYSGFVSCAHDIFHSKRKPWVAHCTQFSCSFSLLSSVTLPTSVFHFESFRSVLSEEVPLFGSSAVSSWLNSSYAQLAKKKKIHGSSVVFFWVHPIRRHMLSICQIPGDANFHHLGKEVSARFLHCFFFVINEHFMEIYFKTVQIACYSLNFYLPVLPSIDNSCLKQWLFW